MFKEIKQELLSALNLLKTKEEFAGDKVYSDSEIKVSDKKVGGKVELISKDGTLTPAPDGDYSLEDGTKFKVKDSCIESIEGEVMETPKTEDTRSPTETDKPEVETPETEKKEDGDIETIKQNITDLQKAIEEIKSMLQGFVSKSEATEFNAQVKDLTDTIKQLAKLPAEFSKTNDSPREKDSKEEKISDIAKVFASIKDKK